MNLYTAKLLMPVQRRYDFPHARLTWVPSVLYDWAFKGFVSKQAGRD